MTSMMVGIFAVYWLMVLASPIPSSEFNQSEASKHLTQMVATPYSSHVNRRSVYHGTEGSGRNYGRLDKQQANSKRTSLSELSPEVMDLLRAVLEARRRVSSSPPLPRVTSSGRDGLSVNLGANLLRNYLGNNEQDADYQARLNRAEALLENVSI